MRENKGVDKHFHAETEGEFKCTLPRTAGKLRDPRAKCDPNEKGLTYKIMSCSKKEKVISKIDIRCRSRDISP